MPILPDSPTGGAAELTGLILDDLIKRVQSALDDPEGTYITADYVLGFAENAYESVYNKLRASGFQFDEVVVELPGVKAGSPNLDDQMVAGGALEMIVKPRFVEWKLAGQQPSLYRPANGPLLAVRDLPAGVQYLDSWAWVRRSLKLSSFASDLDIRVTGQFLFTPLTEPDSPVQMDITIRPALTLAIVLAIAKARGNANWVQTYTPDYNDAIDDLFIEMVKAQQAITYRVARSRRGANQGPNTKFST